MGEGGAGGQTVPAEQNLTDVEVIAPSGIGSGLERYAKDETIPRVWSGAMAVLIARKGEDGFLDEVTDDLLEGCSLGVIAEQRGVRTGELARWLFATPEREVAYRSMLRVKADLMAHETLGIGDNVDTGGENAGAAVAHAKLRIDTRFRLASKWDRRVYGEDKGGVNVGVGVKFVINADDVGML